MTKSKKLKPINSRKAATQYPKSASKRASADDLNTLNKLHFKTYDFKLKEKSLTLAEKYMSDIYPDTE